MSTNVDNRLQRTSAADTSRISLKSALTGEDKEASRSPAMNKAATVSYLNSLSREQDEVGDSLSRSMNRLNQSLGNAMSAAGEPEVDSQAEQMAVYSKLAGKLIDRDSSLQEKVAQNLSSGSSTVRTRDAAESLQKAMNSLPATLKEGTQTGKDLAKFMVENLVTLSDRRHMGAGLERDLAVRQINVPKNQPNSRIQQASSRVLSASIEYVKSNQPEALARSARENAAASTATSSSSRGSDNSVALTSRDNQHAAKQDSATYAERLRQLRQAHANPDTARTENSRNTQGTPGADKPISAEISKRISNLIARAANTAKSGNLIQISPEEAEKFDRSISSQNRSDSINRLFSRDNGSSAPSDGELPPPSRHVPEANVRQLSLAELSARASKLQSEFRAERQRIVQEGKLPDPAEMPKIVFEPKVSAQNSASDRKSALDAMRAHTMALSQKLAAAQNAISSRYPVPPADAEGEAAPNQTRPAQTPADGKAQANTPAESKAPVIAQNNKATADSKGETKPAPAPAPADKPATADIKPQSNAARPATDGKMPPLSMNNMPSNIVNLSFKAVQSTGYGGMDIMPGMTIPVSHFGSVDNDTIQPNQQALNALKMQARILEAHNQAQQSEADADIPTSNSQHARPVTIPAGEADADVPVQQNQNTAQRPAITPNQQPADGDESKAPVNQNTAQRPSIVPQQPEADGDESKAPVNQNTAQRPSIVPNQQPADGDESKAPVNQNTAQRPAIVPNQQPADGDESKAPVNQNTAQRPSIVPNQQPADGDESKAPVNQNTAQRPSIIPQQPADSDESKAPVNQNTAQRPSIVPQQPADGDESKAPVNQNTAQRPAITPNQQPGDGDESKAPVNQNTAQRPSIVPQQPEADGDESKAPVNQNTAQRPSIVPNQQPADGDESKAPVNQNTAQRPSIVPNQQPADGDESKAPVNQNTAQRPSIVPNQQPADGDESKAPFNQNTAQRPSIVPQQPADSDASKAPVNQNTAQRPSIVPQQPADGDESKAPANQNTAQRPSIVPQQPADGDESKAPVNQNTAQRPSIVPNQQPADGDESKAPANQNTAQRPSIVPQQPVADGEEGRAPADLNTAQLPSIVPQPEGEGQGQDDIPENMAHRPTIVPGNQQGMGASDGSNSETAGMSGQGQNAGSASGGILNQSHGGRSNMYARLYGAVQQNSLNDERQPPVHTVQRPATLSQGSLAAQDAQSGSSTAAPAGLSGAPADGEVLDDGAAVSRSENNVLSQTRLPPGAEVDVEAEAADEAARRPATHGSATDVAKTREYLEQRSDQAQIKKEIVQQEQAAEKTEQKLTREIAQDEQIQDKKAVQEEFLVNMQARAQAAANVADKMSAQHQAQVQTQQARTQAEQMAARNGEINQFSRLYSQTLTEQRTQEAQIMGSTRVNTVGDTHIKATGTAVASTTTHIIQETAERAKVNHGEHALQAAQRNTTAGNTGVEQAQTAGQTTGQAGGQGAGAAGQGSAQTAGAAQSQLAQGQTQAAQTGTQGAGQAQTGQVQPGQAQQGAAAQTQAAAQAAAQANAQTAAGAQASAQAAAGTQAAAQAAQNAQAAAQQAAQAAQQAAAAVRNELAQSVKPAQGAQAAGAAGAVGAAGAAGQSGMAGAPSGTGPSPMPGTGGTPATGDRPGIQIPPMPILHSPVISLDEDSLQDEIIKNVIQTVPSDDLDEFGLKNSSNGNQALSGVVADTDLTADNNAISQIINKGNDGMMSSSVLGAAQITSGQNDPIPEESVVNNVATPKEGGLFRRLASLFGRRNADEAASMPPAGLDKAAGADKTVDPSKAALEDGTRDTSALNSKNTEQAAQSSLRQNSLENLTLKLQTAAADQSLPPKMQEQAQNLLKSLNNPVNDLQTVSNWLNFVTGPMSPSSSQAMALHQWAFMLLCIRFEQIGKNVDKFLKKTQGGAQKAAALEPAIKEHQKMTQEMDETSASKSRDLLKETFGQVERMQQQMQSIPQDQSMLRHIPLPPNYQGGKEGSMSAQKRKDEDGGTSWHLNFNLDLENLGALQVKVKLRFPEIQMSFVAEKFETLQKVQAHMPELNARLKEVGLTSRGSNARLGPVSFNDNAVMTETPLSPDRFRFEGNAFNANA
ncbi:MULTISPECIES: flagellar hook-length control protein FliK [unclassified Anaerobiospirillum]|uniref:flagellar hook-length control protein FliK n=1 Tax=unclassified Anaerobiospirillum TaxID=2647410 RepID=UPI001FF38DD6|nr:MULTISPECIES: flagellar hook-length control protein FliK [unclassified Anaerobiospirillum]MCK0535006.1 flagellar hook-length control protein FliK [Anaerobiospirillum sp. NML120511]MCK0540228.1 flagellar hook-length control protein FliK [Anaerobiospirillum sp. NML02-A-032]